MRQDARTHRTHTLAESGRECVEDIHGRREPLGEAFIPALILIYIVGFPLKHGKDSFRSIAALYLLRERVGNKVLSGLLLVLYQGFVQN